MTSRARLVMAARKRRRDRRRLAERLTPFGDLRVLGHGAFSTAYAVGRRRVLKITDARDDAAKWFSGYIKRRLNPHWPRIHRQMRTGRHVCIWMERLHELDATAERQVSYADDLLINSKHVPFAQMLEYAEWLGCDEPWQRCPARLRQSLIALHTAAERAGFRADNKRDAFMRRVGGVIVLVDPFVGGDRRFLR